MVASKGIEHGAPALKGGAVEGGNRADGAKAAFSLLGDERDGDSGELRGVNAAELLALP